MNSKEENGLLKPNAIMLRKCQPQDPSLRALLVILEGAKRPKDLQGSPLKDDGGWLNLMTLRES